ITAFSPTLSTPTLAYAPFGSEVYSQGEDHVKGPADNNLVRDPRAARHQAVDDLRADPADGPLAGTLLAAGPEQALRGAQEAGRRRVGLGVEGSVRAP